MKTKIFIVGVVVLVILLVFVGVRYSDKILPDLGTTSADTQETTTEEASAEVSTTAPEEKTTRAPFVEAQTQIISGKTTVASETTTNEKPTAQLVTGTVKEWPNNEVLSGIPKPDTLKISETLEYKTDKGKRFIIRFESFSYSEFLDYVERLESAGFADNNNRYHIPEAEPTGTAMFYYSYDGERSFGVYWHGKESMAGFDCEIVVCNYDQAK